MAVTLVPDDVMYPKGELPRTLFPDGNIVDSVVTWLEEMIGNATVDGMADADSNQAARYYIYYRAYAAAALRIALLPTTDQRPDVTTSWGQGRVDWLEKKAAENKAAYDGMIATADSEAITIGALFTVASPRRTAYCG